MQCDRYMCRNMKRTKYAVIYLNFCCLNETKTFLNHSWHEWICVRVKERLNREHWTQHAQFSHISWQTERRKKKTAATPKITTTKVRIALLAGFVFVYLALLSFSLIWNIRRRSRARKRNSVRLYCLSILVVYLSLFFVCTIKWFNWIK